MHSVELLEEALRFAQRAGYQLRHEWLGGSGGGGCEIRGRKWLFLDLALNPSEQLDQVIEALRRDSCLCTHSIPHPLQDLLPQGKIAPSGR